MPDKKFSNKITDVERAVNMVFDLLTEAQFSKLDLNLIKQKLMESDWQRLELTSRLRKSMFADNLDEQYEYQLLQCAGAYDPNSNCKVEGRRKDLLYISGYRWCPDCASRRFGATCLICEEWYIQLRPRKSWFICDQCETQYKKEIITVKQHLIRARKAQVPATLTLKQWVNTVQHFNFTCAYCASPYSLIEHFIPISRGGGTTANNCIPACTSCNSQKGDWHPLLDQGTIFESDKIDMIRAYLDGNSN